MCSGRRGSALKANWEKKNPNEPFPISEVKDSKKSQASLKDDKAPSKTVSKKQTKKTTKNKTSKSAVGSNPLNKSSTGLEIRKV
jgi:hypothetical protein